MAFDFVSYIGQQVEQTSPNMFVEEGKANRSFYIFHLVALHLLQLMQQNSADVYQRIVNTDHDWLKASAQDSIAANPVIQSQFQRISAKLEDANDKIAAMIIGELHQLDLNAGLGQAGIEELLTGQTAWIQEHCESWIWDSSDQPQPEVSQEQLEPQPEFREVLKEFSQAILQQQMQQETPVKHHEISSDTSVQPIYHILNVLIALLIIIFLFCTINI